MTEFTRIALSLLPVFIFLTILIFIDTYKLVKLRSVLMAIAAGCLVAVGCMFLNSWLIEKMAVDFKIYSRYVAPVVEETCKAIYVVYLIKYGKVGFMVDAAVFGFAVGAGFAFVENIYYLNSLGNPNILLWAVRGFGTAIMHGGTAAIFGIISKSFSERYVSEKLHFFLPGLALVILIHSGFNHFILPPLQSTLIIMIVFPLLILVVFNRSENATRDWLGIGFDTDILLLDMITSGKISEINVGKYLQSLKDNFPGEVVVDMLCMIRLHLELTIRAKGVLLMRESGFKSEIDPAIKAKFEELKYLEKSIGKTGKLAILPFLHTSSRDLWQLYFIK